jgi:hypothetical protein
MEFAQRNIFPEGDGYEPELSGEDTTLQSFNGIKAIQVHLDHIARLKDYLCARTKEIPDVPMTCYSECLVAQWSHSENGKECANRKLLDSVCKRCEEFHELAAQLVLLTKMDLPEPVLEVVQSALKFGSASSSFQTELAELHVECWYNQ